jgi:hypothetical protein
VSTLRPSTSARHSSPGAEKSLSSAGNEITCRSGGEERREGDEGEARGGAWGAVRKWLHSIPQSRNPVSISILI